MRRACDNDAIIPARFFAGMQTGGPDCVVLHVSELFLFIKDRDLIFAEDPEPLVLMAIANAVDPFDSLRFLDDCSGR